MPRTLGNAPRWLWERPIAHRGLHDDDRPENSLAAFEAAALAGDPIELDVHLSADGEVVVFHDQDLERMTGRPGTVAQTPMQTLRSLRLGDSEQTIPSLDDVLDHIAGRVPLLVELKPPAVVGPLERAVCAVLERHGGEHAVQSFDPYSMLWMRRHAPGIPRGLLSADMLEEDLPLHQGAGLRNLALAPRIRPDFVAYELWSLPYWAPSAWRRMGGLLLAWTVRDEGGLRRAREVADNVIFEYVRP